MSKDPQTPGEIERAASRWLDNLGGWKRRYVDALRNQVRHVAQQLAERAEEIARLKERLRTLQGSAGAMQLLADMTEVPSRYDKRRMVKVKLSLEFCPQRGWCVVRDDEQGGAPHVIGPRSLDPHTAIKLFIETRSP